MHAGKQARKAVTVRKQSYDPMYIEHFKRESVEKLTDPGLGVSKPSESTLLPDDMITQT